MSLINDSNIADHDSPTFEDRFNFVLLHKARLFEDENTYKIMFELSSGSMRITERFGNVLQAVDAAIEMNKKYGGV